MQIHDRLKDELMSRSSLDKLINMSTDQIMFSR